MFKFVNDRQYDVIVFGASGFTGQYVVEELLRTSQKENIKWAISGRNEHKLKTVLEIAAKETAIDAKDVSIVLADINHENSLKEMTAKSQVLIDLVGPYTLYGERVVKACVDTNTHFLDLSGETVFMEEIHVKYDKVAKERGVYIISCCCLSADLWLPYLKRQFVGHVHSVESYTSVADLAKITVSTGTWKSLIQDVVDHRLVAGVRRRLYRSGEVFTKELPETKFPLKRHIIPFHTSHGSGLYILFPRYNESLVRRSAHYRWQNNSERPVQVANYVDVGNWLYLLMLAFYGIFFYLATLFKCGRHLLESHASLMTFGLVKEVRRDSQLVPMMETYVVNGWGNPRRRHPDDEPGGLDPPCDTLVMRLKAPDVGYLSSAISVVQCAYTLLEEANKIPERGGTLTPGVAFGATRVYDRLRDRGITMDLVKK